MGEEDQAGAEQGPDQDGKDAQPARDAPQRRQGREPFDLALLPADRLVRDGAAPGPPPARLLWPPFALELAQEGGAQPPYRQQTPDRADTPPRHRRRQHPRPPAL